MALTFQAASAQILAANRPQDLFGELVGGVDQQLATGKRRFRQLSHAVHPDYHASEPTADHTFARLSRLWEEARAAIAAGTYDHLEIARIAGSLHEYAVSGVFAEGDIAQVLRATYAGDQAAAIKLARSPGDRDLIEHEADVLAHLHELDRRAAASFTAFLPRVIESLDVCEGGIYRRANVLELLPEFVSLIAIRQAHPKGISAQDMSWIFRRLLAVIGYIHHRGVVHGAVLPAHVLVHPITHELKLVDWCYAVKNFTGGGTHIAAISEPYESWYPAEVLRKQPPTPSIDIFMAARCMVDLMGGDPATGFLSTSVPVPIAAFMQGCMIPQISGRPHDAWRLLDEFTNLIERLWGPRTYRPLVMPPQ